MEKVPRDLEEEARLLAADPKTLSAEERLKRKRVVHRKRNRRHRDLKRAAASPKVPRDLDEEARLLAADPKTLSAEERLERKRIQGSERGRRCRQRSRELAAASPEERDKLRQKWAKEARKQTLSPQELLERKRAGSRERNRRLRQRDRDLAAASPEEREKLRKKWRGWAKKSYMPIEELRAKWREKARKSAAGRTALSGEELEKLRAKWRGKAAKAGEKEAAGRRADAPEHLREFAARKKEYRRGFQAKKYAEDIHHKLASLLRSRLRSAVRNEQKRGSAVRDLGCAITDLKTHLESLFQPGMTWDNFGHGADCWCIDHIFPLKRADLTNKSHLLAVCNWRNLRPEWFAANVRKSARVTAEARALFDALVERFS
jgi:hypothetical protein